jgi:hypothetical protein
MQSEIISKYRVYGVGSYDPQSQYFAYVDIWELTVEKIPHNKEAAAAEVVGSNPTRSIFINLDNYGIKSGSFFISCPPFFLLLILLLFFFFVFRRCSCTCYSRLLFLLLLLQIDISLVYGKYILSLFSFSWSAAELQLKQ